MNNFSKEICKITIKTIESMDYDDTNYSIENDTLHKLYCFVNAFSLAYYLTTDFISEFKDDDNIFTSFETRTINIDRFKDIDELLFKINDTLNVYIAGNDIIYSKYINNNGSNKIISILNEAIKLI